jgi:hypothetical protein
MGYFNYAITQLQTYCFKELSSFPRPPDGELGRQGGEGTMLKLL